MGTEIVEHISVNLWLGDLSQIQCASPYTKMLKIHFQQIDIKGKEI